MENVEEIWKPIDEAPHYAVSNLGRVKRIVPDKLNRPMRILKTPLNDKGYPHLNLHFGGRQHLRRLHQLVCEAFHGPRPSTKHEVRHLDGDRTNARADNLAWGTSAENTADCIAHGRFPKGERNGHALLAEDQVRQIREASGFQREIAVRFGVSRSAVASIRQRRNWVHILNEGVSNG